MQHDSILHVFERLFDYYGPQNWWPADDQFEVAVGAVLAQNTSWRNVEAAMSNLKAQNLLSFTALVHAPVETIAQCIQPSGYYNLKARRLHNLLKMIERDYDGDLAHLLSDETFSARKALLSVKGIGFETADAILLYAGQHPVFVVDAYTHRVFSRHNLVPDECSYEELQEEFSAQLTPDVEMFNEYHALIVRVGKEFCKKATPLCDTCPLKGVEG